MIENTINELMNLTGLLQESIDMDIADVKAAKHEKLLERNSQKLESMEKLALLKKQLNEQLAQKYHAGEDITVYKNSVDSLEEELLKLYRLNAKLASIVLPVKEMYKEIIDEVTKLNGGSLVEVRA